MDHRDRHHRHDDEQQRSADDLLRREEWRDLTAPVPVPDFTHQIMGRLGYQRISERAARLHLARRRMIRATAIFTTLLAIAGGMHYYTLAQRARRAEMPTIQNAVSTSLEEGTRAVSDFSRAIRTILTPDVGPALMENPPDSTPDDLLRRSLEWSQYDAERLEVSRVRWSGLL